MSWRVVLGDVERSRSRRHLRAQPLRPLFADDGIAAQFGDLPILSTLIGTNESNPNSMSLGPGHPEVPPGSIRLIVFAITNTIRAQDLLQMQVRAKQDLAAHLTGLIDDGGSRQARPGGRGELCSRLTRR